MKQARANLHIVMCAWHGSLPKLLSDFPAMLSHVACVDVYREWTTGILKEVAEKWLIIKGKNEFFNGVRWYLDDKDGQLSAIYSLMAKIHQSARAALNEDYKARGIEVFSPLKFIEFIDLFRTICNVICNEKKVRNIFLHACLAILRETGLEFRKVSLSVML